MSLWLILFIIFFVSFGLIVFVGAPFVPTRKLDIEKLFDAYKFSKKDRLVDLGSGDGRVLQAMAEKGIRSLGYELNPILGVVSKLTLRRFRDLTEVRVQDFWTSKMPNDTTVVFVFLASPFMTRLERKLGHEASRIGHDITLISYGMKIPGREMVRSVGAMYVYRFEP